MKKRPLAFLTAIVLTLSGMQLLPAAAESGDVNGDSIFSVFDVKLFQNWLLNVPDCGLADGAEPDVNKDGAADVFDLALMKAVLNGYTISVPEPRRKAIPVECILQEPELPTGCEVVSLTILLNYLGYPAEKLTMARNYLPKLDFYTVDDQLYGADFRTTFAGDPEQPNAYGCYAPCIVTAANAYLTETGAQQAAYDLSGTDLNTLLQDYIDNDMPVLIWITSKELHEPKLTTIWKTPSGETLQWLAYEHCVVLTGYDESTGELFVADPIVGNTAYDRETLKQRYIAFGQQAVCIQ